MTHNIIVGYQKNTKTTLWPFSIFLCDKAAKLEKQSKHIVTRLYGPTRSIL